MPSDTELRPKEPGADWLSWSLHLLLGLLIGTAVGFFIWARLLRYRLAGEEQIFYIVASVSLIFGAITSYRGNRAWLPHSVFAPADPPQSRASHACSLLIGGV